VTKIGSKSKLQRDLKLFLSRSPCAYAQHPCVVIWLHHGVSGSTYRLTEEECLRMVWSAR